MEKKIYGLGELEIKGLGDDGTFEAIISGVKTDRHGDTINQEGWVTTNFKKNPVLLWAHDHTIPTVGRAIKTWLDGKNLMMKGEFAPTPFAQEIKLLVEQGFLKAFSVGFMPIEYKFNDTGVDFLKQELLEVSFVNVPAYAEALMKSVAENKKSFKNFIKESDNTLNWEGLTKSDYREELMKEKNLQEGEERSIVFTAKEFEDFKKEIEVKAGKVLSKKNRDLIKSCIDVMQNAITPLSDLLEATTDSKDEKEEGKNKNDVKTIDFQTKGLQVLDKMVEAMLIERRKQINQKK